jgi:5-(carboxyamino)imidazole ribonucleotide mutase
MPGGVPVATVALDGARNAGILAAQIIATSDPALSSRLDTFKQTLKTKVEEAASQLESKGWRESLT